jgi:GR25 family glycosyltransferase involved in LPS biosynthesis
MVQRSQLRKLPDRISLPGIAKKKKSGRGSPMEVEDALDFDPEQCFDCMYINLDKRIDRKKLVQLEMRGQGLKGRRFPAKAGDEVSDKLVTRHWHSKLNCLYDRKTLPALHNMSKGERGCSGSHIALWKQCLRRNDATKPMLILEDDAVLWERSSVQFPELTQRLIAAVEQVWDVENTPVMLYVGCEVVQWRDSRRITIEGPPVLRLREAEYLWQTSSYVIWPAAARELLAHLPIDCPTDCYISKLVLEGYVTAVVACPQIAEQRDPYAKGDIKHTNTYKWQTQA